MSASEWKDGLEPELSRVDLPLREREEGDSSDILEKMEEEIRKKAPKKTKLGSKWLNIERTRDHEQKKIVLEALARIKDLELRQDREHRELDLAVRRHEHDVAAREVEQAIERERVEAEKMKALAAVIEAMTEASKAGIDIDIAAVRKALGSDGPDKQLESGGQEV